MSRPLDGCRWRRALPLLAALIAGALIGHALLCGADLPHGVGSLSAARSDEGQRVASVPPSGVIAGSAVVPTMTRRQEMGTVLNDLGLRRGVELGVQTGKFAQAILARWKVVEEFHLVDVWAPLENYKDTANRAKAVQEDLFELALSKTAPWRDKITVCRNFTTACVHNYPNEYFDFIYVDARHDRKGVLQDLEHWWPKLRKGGVMAGHDYLTQDEILRSQVDEGDDWTLNYDGTRDETRRVVKGAVDDFFMSAEAAANGRLLQVAVTFHKDGYPYSTWSVRRPAARLSSAPPVTPTFRLREDLGDIANQLELARGVELGVRDGRFAKNMLARWKTAQEYHLVDAWDAGKATQEDLYQQAISNTVQWRDNITICRNFTTACVHNYPDEYFDFIYVDARHDRKGVLQDLEHWWPKLRKGGVMAGHDYLGAVELTRVGEDEAKDLFVNYDGTRDETRRGVKGAVDDFFMSVDAEAAGRMRQVTASYRDTQQWRSWAVRK